MEGIETAMSEMEIVQDTHDPTVGAPNRPTIQDGQPSFDSGIQQPSQHDASEDVPSIKFAIDLVEDLVEDLPAHLEVYTYDIATDRRAEYLYCLDKALSIAEEFQSLTLPWFVATSQNRDVIFWVIDVTKTLQEQKRRFEIRTEEYIMPLEKLQLWMHLFLDLEALQKRFIADATPILEFGLRSHIGTESHRGSNGRVTPPRPSVSSMAVGPTEYTDLQF